MFIFAFSVLPALAEPVMLTTGSCPGTVDIAAADLTPGGAVVLLSGDVGSDVLAVGPCAGTQTGLSNLQVRSGVVAGADGVISFSPTLPAGVCSQSLQVLDLSTCEVSNVGALQGSCTEHSAGGSDYLFCADEVLWETAQELCFAVGADLVTLDDATENADISNTAYTHPSGLTSWWIGYNDQGSEGAWEWVSGQSPGYESWQPGEPNNSPNDSDCAELYSDIQTWNDRSCFNSNRPFICEF